MQFFSKVFKSFLTPFASKQVVYNVGPNNFSELLQQFELPQKVKSEKEIVQDYLIKETMASLEIEMLKMEPVKIFKGYQKWKSNNTTFYDWVPCAVRPEILYCSYGKN